MGLTTFGILLTFEADGSGGWRYTLGHFDATSLILFKFVTTRLFITPFFSNFIMGLILSALNRRRSKIEITIQNTHKAIKE